MVEIKQIDKFLLDAKMNYMVELGKLNGVSGMSVLGGKMLADRIHKVCDSIEKDIGLVESDGK